MFWFNVSVEICHTVLLRFWTTPPGSLLVALV